MLIKGAQGSIGGLGATKFIAWYHVAVCHYGIFHYGNAIMGPIASQITSLTIVYSTVYSDADQIKYQSSASLAFVQGIHRGPVSSPHKWPVAWKMFPFDDVIMSEIGKDVSQYISDTISW